MTKKNLKKYFISTLLFLWIGGVAVVATEVFILDGGKNISFFSNNMSAIETASLRKKHSEYIMQGIIPDHKIALNVRSNPIPKATQRKGPLVDNTDTELVSIQDIIQSQRDQLRASRIEPAAGYEGNYLVGEVHNETADTNPFLYTPKNATPANSEETMAGVISRVTQDNSQEFASVMQDDYVLEAASTEEAIETNEIYSAPRYQEPAPEGHAKIAIIIDDMGLTLRSKLVEVMDGPLTLSYLPTGKNLTERTQRAADKGHEIMLHMPMEPFNSALDDGSPMLKISQSDESFKETLDWSFGQFTNFVGVNNHMGSKLTKDKKSMTLFMNYIKGKNLFFIDSKTIGSTVAAETAREMGIPHAERDMFLDHEQDIDFVERALRKTEIIARKNGYAIAIGHPHKNTIEALKKWLPTLEAKGFELVPVSEIVKRPIAANDDLIARQ